MTVGPVLLFVGLMYMGLGLFAVVVALHVHRRTNTRLSSTVGSVLGGTLAFLLGLGVLSFGLTEGPAGQSVAAPMAALIPHPCRQSGCMLVKGS